ncbi:hypothetical protein TFLX_01133 [Thermoflexales bacterium]|nr:hypothetical protein TFLX_01133 [Thermoflexales bacterium]
MPDLHWHVGEGAERETIAKSNEPRRSGHRLVFLLVVMLGAGLGVVYRSLPEPPPHPTPTPILLPTPTRQAIPAKLFDTIDREAQALADGDSDTYRETEAESVQGEIEAQRENFTAWGRPGDDRSLYVIIDFDLLTDTSAWADIRQFRQGRYFRQTRFYYYDGEYWLRAPTSNSTLWSGREESVQTSHFNVIYAVEDRAVISSTLRQLEEDFQDLCRDLGCTSLGQELTFTLKFVGTSVFDSPPFDLAKNEIRLPSPRLLGFFESGQAYSWESNYSGHVYSALLEAIIENMYGVNNFDQPGDGLLWAISIWALNRVEPLPAETLDMLRDPQHRPLLALETLWETGRSGESGLPLDQLYHLVRFIEQEYGASAVTHLLEAIDSAQSMIEAIENGLGVPFAEFDQKWQAWAKQNIPGQ